jgi:protocatechuate 3,4-dioxygenase beta subunit
MHSSKAISIKACVCAAMMLALRLAAQTGGEPATVEGKVIDAVSGLPVARAQVMLQAEGNGPARHTTMSAADGTFSITGISPGTYAAMAQRVGYVNSAELGGPPIMLKAAERKTGVEIRLTPTGSITGRVTNSEGDPVEGAAVFANKGTGGEGFGETGEKGQFRIGGLAPGKYNVRVERNQIFGGRPEIRTDGTVETHNATTYYPSSVTEREAAKVTVKAGAETPGIDIRVVRVPFVRVSGRVVGMPQGAQDAIIWVSQNRNEESGMSLKPDATFETWRLDPGKYRLRADWKAPNGEEVHTATIQIEVAGSNVDGSELRVVPDSVISGRVDFEDDTAKQLSTTGFREHSVKVVQIGDSEDFGRRAPIGADGTFRLEKIPAGKYRVRVDAGATYIKSVRLGGRTIDGTVLDLSRGSDGADLSVVLSAATSSVSGSVQGTGPATSLEVVMVPADEETGGDAQEATVGADGKYTVANVPPGNYKLVAVPEKDMRLQGNNVLGFEDAMESVTVGAQEKVIKDLKRATPADR